MDSNEFLDKIQHAFNQSLPGINSHKLLLPGKRALERNEVEDIASYRDAAVAVICYPNQGEIHSILIQRPDYTGNHGGQVSFPGGKKDVIDSSLEQTARRETFEEIGWQMGESNLIGGLTELFIPVSKFIVKPHLYFCEEMQQFHPDAREVQEIFQFPVKILKEEKILKYTNIQISSNQLLKDVPYFEINNRIVWGATAIILSELKSMLE